MTYNVSMGTLNPTIPYHTILVEILPSEDLNEIWCQYTRMMWLSCGKEIVTMSLVI